MVNKKNITIALIVVTLAGAGYWFFGRSMSPEAQVKKRLDDLCTACSKKVAESAPTIVFKNDSLSKIFANPVGITGDAWILVGSYSPQDLAARIFQGRQMFSTVRLSYTDLTITMDGADKATASFTAKLSVIAKVGGPNRQDNFRQIAAKLSRQENRWVFNQFNVIKVMNK